MDKLQKTYQLPLLSATQPHQASHQFLFQIQGKRQYKGQNETCGL
jgi:hypothetical protein